MRIFFCPYTLKYKVLFNMKNDRLLAKVYRTSSLIILAVLLLICVLFHWSAWGMVPVAAASLVIAAPSMIALHLTCWLLRKLEISMQFAWMLLMALLPLLAILPAAMLADEVPGNAWFLSALGLACGYISLLGNGNAIVKTFKSFL